MLLPQLTPNKQTTETVDQFLGYNHNLRIRSGEFYDMQNLSPDYFPTLCPRGPRGSYEYPVGMTPKTYGMIHKDALWHIEGGQSNATLYHNSSPILDFPLSLGEKQLVSMGAYLLIFPDKKYINTADTSDKGNMGAVFNSAGETLTVSFKLCNIDGTEYSATASSSAPDIVEGQENYWIDISGTTHILKQYSETSSMWIQVPTTYIKISTSGIGAVFQENDGVKLSGLPASNIQLQELEGKTSIIQKKANDNSYIVVIGMLDEALSSVAAALKVEREIPDMDFVIESGNRLWGCYYGVKDGQMLNEIYACKLGDFKNWRCYEGASTDSYAVSCGTDGQWTGAISYMGYPLFFKEDVMHKVYGNYPANFQVQTTDCDGVQKGAGKSLAVVCETLLYKSRQGVCMYSGSLPKLVSSAFGDIHYTDIDPTPVTTPSGYSSAWLALRTGAAAGAIKSRYYISMKSEMDHNWYLFVYDINTGLWHKQDNVHADAFCEHDGELYYIDHGDPSNSVYPSIKSIFGSGTKDTSPIAWFAETGPIETEYSKRQTLTKKYVNKLLIRMSMDIGSQMNIFIQYDSRGEWENIGRVAVNNLRTFSYTIKPKRCNHFKLRFGGIGKVNIYTIIRCYTQGSDVG